MSDVRRLRLAAILIVGLALAVRLAFIAGTPGFVPFADAADYDRVATSLALHGDYPPSTISADHGPSGFRPPAYPFLLAAVDRVTGTTRSPHRYTVGRVLSALLSTLVVALLAGIALLCAGKIAGLVAGGLAAIYPPLVTLGVAMLSEPLFAAAALGALLAVLVARRSDSPARWAAAAGILVGLAALTRTNGIIILLAVAAGLWRAGREPCRSARLLALAAAAALLVVAPWCVREAVVFHRFVAITTQDGFTLAGTYNSVSAADRQYPASWRVPLMAPYDRLLRRGGDEAALDAAFRATALDYARHHPGYVLRVGLENARRLLDLPGQQFEQRAAQESGISAGISDLDVVSFHVLGILAVGALLLGAARTVPGFVWAVPVLMALSLVFIITSMRYRLPIDPFLILLVAAAGERIAGYRRRPMSDAELTARDVHA